jgi:DNA-binding winged helix-turn-helix (wHTH) protein
MKVCEAFCSGNSAGTVEHLSYLFDGFHLDVTRRRLCSSGGLVLPLSSRAMEALLLLVANAGQLVDKRRLMETVWPTAVVEDNNLNQCILAIRKALGEAAGSNRYIMTVPGRGYCFVCPVQERRLYDADTAPEPPSSRARRMGLAAAALLPVLLLMLAGILQPPAPPPARKNPQAEPALVLRLRSRSQEAHGMSASMLANCLALEPGLHLEVSVRLVDEGNQQALWSGDYMAGREDLLSLQEAAVVTASCPGTATR